MVDSILAVGLFVSFALLTGPVFHFLGTVLGLVKGNMNFLLAVLDLVIIIALFLGLSSAPPELLDPFSSEGCLMAATLGVILGLILGLFVGRRLSPADDPSRKSMARKRN